QRDATLGHARRAIVENCLENAVLAPWHARIEPGRMHGLRCRHERSLSSRRSPAKVTPFDAVLETALAASDEKTSLATALARESRQRESRSARDPATRRARSGPCRCAAHRKSRLRTCSPCRASPAC